MRVRQLAIGGLLLLVACGSEQGFDVGDIEGEIVYGTDDRLDVFAHPDASLAQVARESVVALIPASRLTEGEDGVYEIDAPDLQTKEGTCPDAAFVDQPAAGICSGILIAEDLVLTAGHCAGPEEGLPEFRYVFNYHLEEEGQTVPVLRESDVYSFGRLVLNEDPSSRGDITPDFAIIELDRAVTPDHVPVAIRPATPLEPGDPISMIGSPTGLPTKIDSGGMVASAPGNHYLTNLDAFGGHSGAGAFDEEGRLAGILVVGKMPDYAPRPGANCFDVNVIDDSQAGEALQQVAPVIHALCEAGEAGDELCGDRACDGESCSAPPKDAGEPPVDEPPTPPVGVVAAGSSGCSVGGLTSAPGVTVALLALWMLAGRLRRRVA